MTTKTILLLSVGALALTPAIASADEEKFNLCLYPPDVQLVKASESIAGIRLNLWGRNEDMSGIDLGFIHESGGNFSGFALGLISLVDEECDGASLNFVYTRSRGSMEGWASALFTSVGPDSSALSTGLVNFSGANFTGAQLGFIWNGAAERTSGCQIAFVNNAGEMHGLQLGLVNFASDMNGLQLGLWNQINSKDSLRIFPFVNWKF